MSDTVDIGAARIRLIVDSTDMQDALQQGKSYLATFGSVAQASYDKTEKGTRRAADALVDYVAALGSADTTMTRLYKTASKMGVEKPVLDAATQAWQNYQHAVELTNQAQTDAADDVKRTTEGYKDLVAVQVQAELQAIKLANAQAAVRATNNAGAVAANAQNSINALVAPGLAIDPETIAHRLSSEEAFKEIIEAESAALEAQQELEAQALADHAAHVRLVQAAYKELISTQQAEEKQLQANANAAAQERVGNLQQAHAANAQAAFNSVLGVSDGPSASQSAQAQADAEAAFGAAVIAANTALEEQLALTKLIDDARAAQNAANAQQDFNKLLGIPDQQQDLALIQARKNATAAFLPLLEEEAQLEQENTALVGKQQSFLQELENIQSTAGKTYYELLELRAAQLGLADAAAPGIAAIKANNEATGAGTISAKQYAFALRGLPAQFSDIVVSLQGGQRPLTVLLQQGAQIKDMFGGVGAAIKVVAAETLKIVTNPFLIMAAVLAAVAAAAFEATSRIQDLAVATAKGNQVAGSAEGLSNLAVQLSKLDHTSLSNADAAVENLAASGKLTGANFAEAAQASARWATITGQSVDDVAGKFEHLAADPMAGVIDGTLRITGAQDAQLMALERTGDKVGEVALAIKLYQAQVNDNSDEVLKHLTAGEQGWINLKDAIEGAVHSLGVWAKDSAGLTFTGIANALASYRKGAPDVDTTQAGEFQVPGDDPSALPSPTSAAAQAAAQVAVTKKQDDITPAQAAANAKASASYDELGTKQQKFIQQLGLLQGELKSTDAVWKTNHDVIESTAGVLSGPGYDRLVNGLHLKIFGQGAGGDPTLPIKEWQKTALDMLKVVGDAAAAEYADGDTTAEDYYSHLNKLAEESSIIQLEAINQEIAALKKRADPNDANKLKALEQERATVSQTTAATVIKNIQDESKAVQARTVAYLQYVQTLADANIELSRQGDQAVSAVGTGSKEQGLNVAISNAQYQEQLKERAAQQAVDNLPGDGDHAAAQVEANEKIAAAQAALTTQLTIIKGNYAALNTAQSDFFAGAKKGWQDWSDNVVNQAAEASKLTTTALDGIADAFTNVALTGKLSFKSLFDSLEKELIEFGFKVAESEALKYLNNLGSQNGSQSGDIGTNFGGILTTIGSFIYGSAKGNAFSGGSGLGGYRNQVVSAPTYFPFARGGVPNVGLMGEKSGSPGEAIMPLTRTSGGELAVKTTGGAARPINVQQNFAIPGGTNKNTQSQIATKAAGGLSRATRRG